MRALVLLIAVCALCAGCGGKTASTSTTKTTTTKATKGPTGGYASSRAELAGMKCGSIGLHGGAAIGRYILYVCAGPDNAKLGIPIGDFVCWGFNDFGVGHDQPAVELNLMDRIGRTIGGHVFPGTTVNCVRTLRLVIGVIS